MSLKDSIAAGYKIIHDANLQNIAATLDCKISSATDVLQRNMAQATLTKPEILVARQAAIIQLRKNPPQAWDSRFDRAAEIEEELTTFFQEAEANKDSLENDSIAQLSFQDDYLKPLNHVPWMIMLIAIFKVWIVPTITLLTRIIAWAIPYLLLRFVYALPIDQQEYAHILQGMWLGNMTPPGVDLPAAPQDMLSPRSILQFILFGFSFAQGMIQPIQNAMHLYKTDRIITDLGKKLLELRDIMKAMKADAATLDVKLTSTLEELEDSDYRRAFMLVKEQPERLQILYRDLANLEVLWRIASAEHLLQPVVFKPDVLFLEEMTDISLTDGVSSSLELVSRSQRHAVITGPNGGGKSSFLRATLQCVVLGHSYGVAPAQRAFMPRFHWIASGLQLRDTPGLYSMFETEVKFAADCIRSSRISGPGLVLFDELFHSTNPPDGTRSAKVFLKELWSPESNVFSVISTHVFPLVENAPDNVQAICCPASQSLDGRIHYSYKAEPGICQVSSVRTVWQKYGLI